MKMIKSSVDLNNLNQELRAALTAILGSIKFLHHGTHKRKLCIKDLKIFVCFLQNLVEKVLALIQEINTRKSSSDSNNVNFFSSKSSVLLVEDAPIIQRVHKKMLEKLGFCVELAESRE